MLMHLQRDDLIELGMSMISDRMDFKVWLEQFPASVKAVPLIETLKSFGHDWFEV